MVTPFSPSSGSSSAASTHSSNAAALILTLMRPVWTHLAQWTYNTLCSDRRPSRSAVFAPGSMLGYYGGALGGGLKKSPFRVWKTAGAWSMPKWHFPLTQYCGVSTAIRFVQICLNQVCRAEYLGSPEILWMTLWGIPESTLSCETFVVAVIAPVRRLMPFICLGVLLVFL